MALVILMRHGKAWNNVERILVGRELESHLTEEGEEQVKEAAAKLSNIDIRRVYTSPITRARETAEIVCKELSLDYMIDDRLIEVDTGRITGLRYNEVIERYGDIFSKFYEDSDPILDKLKIERFAKIRERIDSLLNDISKIDENVLLVTHLDPIKAAISNVLGLSGRALFKLLIPNASLTLLKHGSSEYSLLALNVMDIVRYAKLP